MTECHSNVVIVIVLLIKVKLLRSSTYSLLHTLTTVIYGLKSTPLIFHLVG